RRDSPAIFGVVNFRELFPDRAIGDLFRPAFEDDSFAGIFGSNDDLRNRSDVFCLACARPSAEPEGILPPNSPNDHEVRAAVRPRGGNPIVMRLLDALQGPGPGFRSEEHTSELQSLRHLVCRLLLEKKKKQKTKIVYKTKPYS